MVLYCVGIRVIKVFDFIVDLRIDSDRLQAFSFCDQIGTICLGRSVTASCKQHSGHQKRSNYVPFKLMSEHVGNPP